MRKREKLAIFLHLCIATMMMLEYKTTLIKPHEI